MDDLYAGWAPVYDYFYPDRSGEVRFWSQVALSYGQRALDLMCGTAEVSLGLARCGLAVLGVDSSPAMLAEGAARLATAADYPARGLELAQGDACRIPVPDGQFDFALVGGSGSFNHLDDEQAAVSLGELSRALRPGGGLGLEMVNPYLVQEIDPERLVSLLRPLPGMRVERRIFTRHEPGAHLLHIRQVTMCESVGDSIQWEECFPLYVRGTGQMRTRLKSAGFGEIRFYGGQGLEAFDRWSSDLLVLARRSASSRSDPPNRAW